MRDDFEGKEKGDSQRDNVLFKVGSGQCDVGW